MSNQTNGEAKRLTTEDPVSPETLAAFQQILGARQNIAMELMALEQLKIQLLAGNKKLQEQHDRLFQAILVERGLAPQTPAELDAKTGKITVVHVPQSPPEVPLPTEQPS